MTTQHLPTPTRKRGSLAARLLGAQTLVLLGSAVTSWVVASVVAPGIFHTHLERAGVSHTASETLHVERAFTDSLLIALGVALVTSVLMAFGVTAYFTRRVQRSTAAVAASAADIAAGQYGARVPRPGLGSEFDVLATTINELAARLGDVETTRRRILADLAHEMRTPLASIEAHLEAVEDGVRELDAATLAVLRDGTQRLHRLAEDVSAVSHAEEGRLESRPVRTRPQALLEAAAAAARDSYDAKGVALVVGRDTTGGQVLVDPQRMAQVLGNLLDNALRHTPPDGTVTLTVHQADRRWVELEVLDTGEGIDPEHLPHVFERFYRADPARARSRGGSGIGLTISRALVEAHGGGISAASPGPGRGAAFTVRLPVAVEQ
ncbi:HAMP domain-containing sensor histidine kinase [Knoellia sp. 3-2P3]|uniref:sensor histidine kinase n=1 Tax=unclassified Knoellia TaxID=2618719 RepID=UPI0023D9C9CC|nr:HAMP domain-containing sensor histidine kinase [Knoellia sp. 3-2P3]MDF2093655.1 HAMP domain-containing sensor histidine kinase [Knoellia sp. 3-2P3]